MAEPQTVLWSIHQVNWEDQTDTSKDDIWEDATAGPDRRLFLVEGEARAAVEAEVLAARSEERREEGKDPGTGEWLPDVAVDWRPTAASDPTWELDRATPYGHRSSKWHIEEWNITYFVVPLTVLRN